MRKVFFFLGMSGVVAVATAGAACGDAAPERGEINLPPRAEAGQQGEAGPIADSSTPSCTNLSLKVGEPAACDNCAKAKCCGEVLACTESEECTALQQCLEPCAQTDFLCIVTCQETHPDGNDVLGKVGSCARSKCKAECPTDIPDADIFGDGGL